MQVVIATDNKHKVNEFQRILEPFGINVITKTMANANIDVEENINSFEENAFLKANAIYQATKLMTIADDSGICVDALNGQPGIFSARYGGEECKNDFERTQKLLFDMKNHKNRNAHFHCDICLITTVGKVFHFTGDCNGEIGFKVCGENGFGYDPIFMVGENSFSQLTDEQKDEISHRGIALKKLKENFNAIIEKENL